MRLNRLLIVGGTGYLGRNLSSYLSANGYEVHMTGTRSLDRAQYYRVDFSDPETFDTLKEKQFDIALILAAKTDSLGTVELVHQDLKNNTVDYSSFLNFLGKNKIASRLLYTSSMTVYSENNISPVVETGQLNPLHTYGLSKLLAEQITSFFCNRWNIPGLILRLPGIYGGDRNGGYIYNTIQKFKTNQEIILNSKGLGIWETIHINDLCSIIEELLSNYAWEDSILEVFNVGYGQEIDFYETAAYIGKILGSSQQISLEGEKGYKTFFLSNKKLGEFVTIDFDYFESLKRYIQSLN